LFSTGVSGRSEVFVCRALAASAKLDRLWTTAVSWHKSPGEYYRIVDASPALRSRALSRHPGTSTRMLPPRVRIWNTPEASPFQPEVPMRLFG
jgi:hypothetical protein